jgi:hypothetical protein
MCSHPGLEALSVLPSPALEERLLGFLCVVLDLRGGEARFFCASRVPAGPGDSSKATKLGGYRGTR